jgi:hypothetical protein
LIDQKKGLIIIMWDGNDGLGAPVPVNTAFPSLSLSVRVE